MRHWKGKIWPVVDNKSERIGADVADLALFALSLPRGTVSQLIPQALYMPS